MFAIGPATALVAIIAAGSVLARSGEPGWERAAASPADGRCAALAAGLPGAAQLVAYLAEASTCQSARLSRAVHGRPWRPVYLGRPGSAAGPGRRATVLTAGALQRARPQWRLRAEESAEGGRYRGDEVYWPDAARPDAMPSNTPRRDNARAGAARGWQDGRESWPDGGDGWRTIRRQIGPAARTGALTRNAVAIRRQTSLPAILSPGDFSWGLRYRPTTRGGAQVGGADRRRLADGAYLGRTDPGGHLTATSGWLARAGERARWSRDRAIRPGRRPG